MVCNNERTPKGVGKKMFLGKRGGGVSKGIEG